MQTHIIISYDGTDNDHDALALGASSATPAHGSRSRMSATAPRADPAAEQAAQAQAEEILERGARLARPSRGRPPRRPQRLDRRRPGLRGRVAETRGAG